MKRIFILFFITIFTSLLFCNEIEYKITNINSQSLGLKPGTLININEDDIFRSVENKHSFIKIFFSLNNKSIQLQEDEVELSKSKKLFQDSKLKEFIPVWYFDILVKQDINLIYNYQPKWNKIKQIKNDNSMLGEDFLDSFYPESFEINNLYFYMSRGQGFPISKIESKKDYFKIYIHRTKDAYIAEDYPYPDEYEKVINEENFILFMKFDGDYVDVWINNLESYLGKYALAPAETCFEIQNLLLGKCDLTNVTWPRHADGSCDYK